MQRPLDGFAESTTSLGSLRKVPTEKSGFAVVTIVKRSSGTGSIESAVSTASTVSGYSFANAAQQPETETRLRSAPGAISPKRIEELSRVAPSTLSKRASGDISKRTRTFRETSLPIFKT